MQNPRAATGRRRATAVAGTVVAALGATALTAIPASAVTGAGNTSVNVDVDGDYALDAAHGWIKNGTSDFGVEGDALRLSNATTSGNITQLVSPRVDEAAGEPGSGAAYDEFDAHFTVASETGGFQPGLRLEIAPDDGNGSRQGGSFVLYHNPATQKLEIGAIWSELGTSTEEESGWYSKTLASVDPTVSHDIRLRHHFVVNGQDRVSVYVDGALVGVVGTYEQYRLEASPDATPGTINSLLFRASRSVPSANGIGWSSVDAAPDTEGHGFLISNLGYKVDNATDETTDVHTTERTIESWKTTDTRATGHYALQNDGLRVWTTAPLAGVSPSTDKSAGYLPYVRDLDLIGDPSWDVTPNSGSQPGKQIGVDLDDDGAFDGYLVKEDNFDFWWLGSASDFAKNSSSTPRNANEPAYRQLQGSLADWKRAFPDAVTTEIGYSLGSGAVGDATIHSMTVGDTTFSFGNFSCSATDTQVVHRLTDWASDTRATGHNVIEGDGLHVWTEGDSSTDKAALYMPVDASLREVGEPSLEWTGSKAQPGYQLALDVNGDGKTDGYLVGEPASYGNDWWLPSSSWYADALKNAAPSHSGGFGSDNHGTLAQWSENLEKAGVHARVVAIGYSLGSGVKGDGVISSLSYGCNTVTFAEPTASSVSAADVTTFVGQSASLTVHVSGDDATGGTVSVAGWGAPVPVVDGVATLTVPASLPLGTQSVTVNYSGSDAVYSSSAAVNVTVKKYEAYVSAVGGAVQEGSHYALPVVVIAPGVANVTGPVTVQDGTKVVGSGSLVDGVVTLTLDVLAVGTHHLAVFYAGTASVNSASADATVVVSAKPVPPVTVYSSYVFAPDVATSVNTSSSLPVQVIAPGASATGTIKVTAGGKTLGTATLKSGKASVKLPALSAGTHTVTVAFTSSSKTVKSSVTTAKVVVAKAVSEVLVDAPTTGTFGKSTTMQVVVAASNGLNATGKVEVREGKTVLKRVNLHYGAAVIALPKTLKVGTHKLSVVYLGTSQIASSKTSGTFKVAKATSKTSYKLISKRRVAVSVYAPGVKETGKVQLVLDPTAKGAKTLVKSATIKAGKATITLPRLSYGTYKVTVKYAGTNDVKSSKSVTRTITLS